MNPTLAAAATTTATATAKTTSIVPTTPACAQNLSLFFNQFAYGTEDIVMEPAVVEHKEGEPPLSPSPPPSLDPPNPHHPLTTPPRTQTQPIQQQHATTPTENSSFSPRFQNLHHLYDGVH
eukprot:15346584-Ditylum_brightwellii.AAC.1